MIARILKWRAEKAKAKWDAHWNARLEASVNARLAKQSSHSKAAYKGWKRRKGMA